MQDMIVHLLGYTYTCGDRVIPLVCTCIEMISCSPTLLARSNIHRFLCVFLRKFVVTRTFNFSLDLDLFLNRCEHGNQRSSYLNGRVASYTVENFRL